MKLIGLCGRSGSGKSECGYFIEEMGIAVIDCDVVYHGLITKGSPLLTELTGFFGTGILDSEGNLDRKALSAIVFSDDELLKKLNEITHRHILKSVLERAEEASGTSSGGLVVIQAPLLFESGLDKKCDKTVGIIASDKINLVRLNKRDCLTKEQAAIRLSKQTDDDFLKKNCDYIIYNDSDLITLKRRTEEVFGKILEGV